MAISIRLASGEDRQSWENYIDARPAPMFCERWAWREILARTYGLDSYWFVAEERSRITGVLALTHSNHPLFGNYLATAPFDSYGGLYAESLEVQNLLLDAAIQLRQDLKASYILLRHRQGESAPPPGWTQDPAYATYTLDLPADPQDFWMNHLRAKQRNQVAKGLEQDFSIRFGRTELLDDYWSIITRTMRELGSPFHKRAYIEHMLAILGSNVEFAIVYLHGKTPVGGSLLIYDGSTANHLHSNVINAYKVLCAGDYLYWSVIQHCIEKGLKVFEMGRSLIGSNNEYFKSKWRPQKQALAYWYNVREGAHLPHINQANPQFSLAISAWKMTPLFITRAIGPLLIRGVL